MTQHTQGEWIWDEAGEQIHTNNGEVIVYELGTNEAANRLIASAPKLLEAINKALPLLVKLGDTAGNGTIDIHNPNSMGIRCDAILELVKARECAVGISDEAKQTTSAIAAAKGAA